MTCLSMYFFVLCMEKHSLLFNVKVKRKEWFPIKVSKDGPSISHLLVVDNVLLFSQATIQQACVIRNMFYEFCQASGLKINEYKSKAFYLARVTRSIKISI